MSRLNVAADFPNPASVYPIESRQLEREGFVVVRVCVDAQGKTTTTPTLAKTSGSSDLDSAGVLLATMGSGHYLAPRRDGAPFPGCGELGFRFVIAEDPRWPSLDKREKLLTGRFRQGVNALNEELAKAGEPQGDLRSWEDLLALRRYIALFDYARLKTMTLTSEYVAGMDELAHSTGEPPAESKAFQAYWERGRETAVQYDREMDADAREFIKALNQLADYYERAKPPLLTASGAATPTPGQQRQLSRLAERSIAAAARAEATADKFYKQAADEARKVPAGPSQP